MSETNGVGKDGGKPADGRHAGEADEPEDGDQAKDADAPKSGHQDQGAPQGEEPADGTEAG